ncbi:MAG: DDE-type integrase/transposase/recombinase [Gammaproteobacteria bacterium]|nr:DDE-type integrase/transposase/recombinase [Gammaproteobacteria bacterium]
MRGEIRVPIDGVERKVYFVVNPLGDSRRFHVVASFSFDAEHTYESLVQGFTSFAGVPRVVLIDNQKAAVLEHRASAEVRFNRRFADLAGHYGFVPKVCRPYRARTQGKTDPMVH